MAIWFRRKLFGWGWYPATWQGWMVVVVFVVLLLINSFRFDRQAGPGQLPPLSFFLETAFLVATLLVICFKTGESPRWQWGTRRD